MENSPLRKYKEVHIAVPWGHIAGRWYGENNVRPILALHGWLDNYGTWDTLIPLMPPHIGVLAIDMPGHGKSSNLPPGVLYHVLHYVTIIIRIMKEYNWDKVSILAHSMSAINSFIFTCIFPDKVDMLIQIDIIHPRYRTPDEYIQKTHDIIENVLIEEKRNRVQDLEEPPSYSYEQLIERMYVGSSQSVDKDKCENIVRNNVTKSTKYPSKYYFSRDGKVKHYIEFFANSDVVHFMAKRIKVPQLVIKGSESYYIQMGDPAIQVLRDNNPYFEFHVLKGTHHVHLNNPEETSVPVNAFINKWRPPPTPEEKKPQPETWVDMHKKQQRLLHKAKL